MSELVLPNGREYVPPTAVRPEPADCPECGADESAFKPVLGGRSYCSKCGYIKESE